MKVVLNVMGQKVVIDAYDKDDAVRILMSEFNLTATQINKMFKSKKFPIEKNKSGIKKKQLNKIDDLFK
ncbi:MAG: hypothetical protein ACYDEI_00240 [Erysipelotrichaceae bacterium]